MLAVVRKQKVRVIAVGLYSTKKVIAAVMNAIMTVVVPECIWEAQQAQLLEDNKLENEEVIDMKVNKKNKERIKRCESVYLVVRYAHWCVREFKWTGKWNFYRGTPRRNPVVYDYNDHNGEYAEYQLIDIFHTTTGQIFMWTFDKYAADKVAEMLEECDNAEVNR